MNTVDRIPFNKKIDLSNYNVIIFPYDEDMNPIDEFYINNNIGRDKFLIQRKLINILDKETIKIKKLNMNTDIMYIKFSYYDSKKEFINCYKLMINNIKMNEYKKVLIPIINPFKFGYSLMDGIDITREILNELQELYYDNNIELLDITSYLTKN